jgi:hypothetical protein
MPATLMRTASIPASIISSSSSTWSRCQRYASDVRFRRRQLCCMFEGEQHWIVWGRYIHMFYTDTLVVGEYGADGYALYVGMVGLYHI